MNNNKKNGSIAIIGAGFAGIAAGIYARLNGYEVNIFEMHDLPGGLCTSWERKGFTFDCCVHWLVGSSPESGLHDLWEETGVANDLEIINLDEYIRYEDNQGRTLDLHTDIDRLEKYLLEFSPTDEIPVRKLISGIRMCLSFDYPSKHDPFLKRTLKQIGTITALIRHGSKMKYWMKKSCGEFAAEFSDPTLSEVFREIWGPHFSMLFILFILELLNI